MPRLFVALDIPDTVKDTLADVRRRSDLQGAAWTKRPTWHITLHFIGEAMIDPVDTALQTVQAESFALSLNGVGVFPEQGRPRVLWAGLQTAPALFTLHEKIGQALRSTGYQPDTRPYHPHITLARFKQDAPGERDMERYLTDQASLTGEPFPVTHFTLYESHLTPQGAQYHARGQYSLQSPS